MTSATVPRSVVLGGKSRFRRIRSTFGVGIVAAAILALTIGYYAAVLGGLGRWSYITVGVAFLLGTDGLLLAFTVGRRPPSPVEAAPSLSTNVTAVIACYNGADVIGDTIAHLLPHVPADRIIVVSDSSTDDTAAVASSFGVRVVENRFNRNKALSINRVAPMVTTRYTLILDDDTLLGAEPIPVGLLDDGYAAVAFDVMPIATGTLVNQMQNLRVPEVDDAGKGAHVRGGRRRQRVGCSRPLPHR